VTVVRSSLAYKIRFVMRRVLANCGEVRDVGVYEGSNLPRYLALRRSWWSSRKRVQTIYFLRGEKAAIVVFVSDSSPLHVSSQD